MLKHHASIGLPQEYVDSGPNSFIIASKSQLTKHLTAGTHTILLAQQHFDTYSHTVAENLRGGQRLPKRKKKSEKQFSVFNLDTYWNIVGLEVAELYVLMAKTCAAEAATERTFSSEAIIHDMIRNSMDPELTSKILKVRWNFEKIKQISIRTGLTTEKELNGIYNDTFDDDLEEEED